MLLMNDNYRFEVDNLKENNQNLKLEKCRLREQVLSLEENIRLMTKKSVVSPGKVSDKKTNRSSFIIDNATGAKGFNT